MSAATLPAALPPPEPAGRGPAFLFGFDGEAFASRRSPAQRYWTEYAPASRAHRGLAAEFALALVDAAGRLGRMEIAWAGGPVGLAAAALAPRLGLPARVLSLSIDGLGPPTPMTGLPARRIEARFEELEGFALGFARAAGCGNAWAALSAFAASHAQWPVLADHGEVRLLNHGIDERLGIVAAPASLALVDNEGFTAIDRWLGAERRPGEAQLLRRTPELVAAQLDSPSSRGWMADALAGGAPALRAWTNHAARGSMWRRAFPGLRHAEPRAAWPDPAFRARMQRLSLRMRRARPGCATQHFTPLHRLLPRLGLEVPPGLDEDARLYGRVEMPAAAGALEPGSSGAGEEAP